MTESSSFQASEHGGTKSTLAGSGTFQVALQITHSWMTPERLRVIVSTAAMRGWLGYLQQHKKKECSTMWSFSING